MNSKAILSFFICAGLLFVTGSVSSQGQSQCQLKKEQDNIKIYSCSSKDSRLNTVRVEFEVNTTMDKYLAVALNVKDFSTWHYREANPKILKKINEHELIYHTQISAPFPVSNRDLILHVKAKKDTLTKTSVITIESLANYMPEIENVVRVPQSYSQVTLRAVNESKLRIEYFIQVDPGGQLPVWLVNMFSTQAPFQTFRNLIKKLEGEGL
jgi:hypothetical protein